MVGFDQVVSQVMFNITGLSVDITTVAVGAIVIFVLILGVNLLRVVILGVAAGSSGDNTNFDSCDNSLKKVRKQEHFMNMKYGRNHSREWDNQDDKYIKKRG